MKTWQFSFAGAFLIFSAALLADTEQVGLTIANFKDYEEITYAVPLIRGTYTCPRKDYNKIEKAPEVYVKNETTGRVIKGTGLSRRYKVWPRLVYGTNVITVTVKTAERTEENQIRLIYKRPQTDFLCKVYWLVDKNGENLYYSPYGENDPQHKDPNLWRKKFETQLRLCQTFLGDSMYRNGYPRRVFTLDTDQNDELHIQVVTSKYTRAEICSWLRPDGSYDEGKLYAEFVSCLGDRKGNEFIRPFGIPNVACIVSNKVRGATALGGYSLAQFGSTGIYSWPSSLDEVIQCFTNCTPITTCMNDSVGRNVQWGHCATTMGAYMHEAGHCFGLPHIEGDKYNSVMARSYDILNRLFTSWEEPSSRNPERVFFEERDEPVWSRIECHILSSVPNINQWRGTKRDNPPTWKLLPDDDTILIHADNGLNAVTFWGLKYRVLDTPNCHLYPLDGSVKEATLSLSQMRNAMQTEEKFEIKVWDCHGNHIWPIIDTQGKPTTF